MYYRICAMIVHLEHVQRRYLSLLRHGETKATTMTAPVTPGALKAVDLKALEISSGEKAATMNVHTGIISWGACRLDSSSVWQITSIRELLKNWKKKLGVCRSVFTWICLPFKYSKRLLFITMLMIHISGPHCVLGALRPSWQKPHLCRHAFQAKTGFFNITAKLAKAWVECLGFLQFSISFITHIFNSFVGGIGALQFRTGVVTFHIFYRDQNGDPRKENEVFQHFLCALWFSYNCHIGKIVTGLKNWHKWIKSIYMLKL